MGLEKAIKHKKEKRKPYRGGKAVSCQCRNHGSCTWCKENRTISTLRRQQSINDIKRIDEDDLN